MQWSIFFANKLCLNAHLLLQLSKKRVWGLCCLMTPGLIKIFSIMYDHTPSNFADHQIKHQATFQVGYQNVIADGHLKFLRFLCGCAWVNILTLSPPEGLSAWHHTMFHWPGVKCLNLASPLFIGKSSNEKVTKKLIFWLSSFKDVYNQSPWNLTFDTAVQLSKNIELWKLTHSNSYFLSHLNCLRVDPFLCQE